MAERFDFPGRTETLLALESALALAGWSGIHELLSELRERHPSRCTDVDLAAAGVITVKPEGDWWVAQFRSSSLHAANAAAERLATSSAAATVGAPDGHRVAPLRPTVEMEVAGFESAAWDGLSDAVLKKKGWPYSCRESAECVRAIYQAMLSAAPGTAQGPAPAHPIDMVLHCPSCGLQHVDAPEDADCDGELVHSFGWSNPPHRSHLCHGCGHIWRPADVPTNGVKAVQTKGKADSPIQSPAHAPDFGKLAAHWLKLGDQDEREGRPEVADAWRVCADQLMQEAAVQSPAATHAARDVLAERRRQISAEGWTPEHDDGHDDGSLAIAAARYALASLQGVRPVQVHTSYLSEVTGWASDWFKPQGRRRNLVKAGALVLAEIERLDRASKPPAEGSES